MSFLHTLADNISEAIESSVDGAYRFGDTWRDSMGEAIVDQFIDVEWPQDLFHNRVVPHINCSDQGGWVEIRNVSNLIRINFCGHNIILRARILIL